MNEKKKEKKNALVVAEQPHSRVECGGWTATLNGCVWWLKSHIQGLSVVAEKPH